MIAKSNTSWRSFSLCMAAMIVTLLPAASRAELRLRDICRVKGQEENTLHGLGLVVGLNGTGDGNLPTTRALAKMMELMGSPISADAQGQPLLDELQNARNVALVFVTATIPAEGARQGEELNCTVSAISANSLEGGYLMLTPLLGPRPGDTRIYAAAQGLISLDASGPTTTGTIHGGCRLEYDFGNSFVKDGKITLVLDKSHASFQTAYDIEAMLNDPGTFGEYSFDGSMADNPSDGAIAKALDQVNIEVRIPPAYEDNHVQFVAEVLDTRLLTPAGSSRVVINERNGVIVIGQDVEVGAVAVTHKNLSIQTGPGRGNGPLFILDSGSDTSTTRLQALVDALNALKVNTQDIIDIIKELERSGDLYGHLIIQ